jgi:hypothetical protein
VTGPATLLNDENILVIGKKGIAGDELKAQKKFAGYAGKEIERIIATYGE